MLEEFCGADLGRRQTAEAIDRLFMEQFTFEVRGATLYAEGGFGVWDL